jgi:hypothetical protein
MMVLNFGCHDIIQLHWPSESVTSNFVHCLLFL